MAPSTKDREKLIADSEAIADRPTTVALKNLFAPASTVGDASIEFEKETP
jgi:hypothetical protein